MFRSTGGIDDGCGFIKQVKSCFVERKGKQILPIRDGQQLFQVEPGILQVRVVLKALLMFYKILLYFFHYQGYNKSSDRLEFRGIIDYG